MQVEWDQLPADYNKQGRRKRLDKFEVVLVQLTNLFKQNRLLLMLFLAPKG
jgi:hypothetical protein